ncbi:cation:proton antiporter [Micromonospora sp. FIMYZ51]|uniref:cation:proton antiporter n=1 Tax=Micromonospora sp. FIMYZ51 TaxID=3051832 RepID=UPI0031203374
MTLTTFEVAMLMATIAIVVFTAQAVGNLFARFRQPAVIGEILAGLVCGPTVLGLLAPEVKQALFPQSGAVAAILAGLGQLGLLLLMFVTGSEIRVHSRPRDRRTIGLVSTSGLVLPFVFGLAIVMAIDHQDLTGPAGSRLTTALVFAIAVAVTSIPVISRIMLDLGLLRESFARIVLSVAAIEDVVLYIVLAVVLSLANSPSSEFGLWALTGIEDTAWSVGYHVTVTVLFLSAFLMWGTPLFRWLLHGPIGIVSRRGSAAYRLVLLLVAVLACILLGINAIFGALLTGLCARRADEQALARSAEGAAGELPAAVRQRIDDGRRSWDVLRQFSTAFFIPIYFFTVGLNLDLARNLDLIFFTWFFLVCCLLKAVSVLVGALLAGQPMGRSIDLSVALNARGGPGIVLATVTLSAGVVNESFFTSMVLLSVLTSLMAGFWLERRLSALRDEERDLKPADAPSVHLAR